MPKNGPNAGGKTKRVYVDRKCSKRTPIPEPLPSEPWTHVVEKIWADLRALPHSVDFTDADWTMAHHALIALNRFYLNASAPAGLAIEGRKALDALGFTSDARERLAIEYVSAAEYKAKYAPPKPTRKKTADTKNVVDFRKRLA